LAHTELPSVSKLRLAVPLQNGDSGNLVRPECPEELTLGTKTLDPLAEVRILVPQRDPSTKEEAEVAMKNGCRLSDSGSPTYGVTLA
jgi:hypothetical protein